MRTQPTDVIDAMLELLWAFEGRCNDNATIKELIALCETRHRWPEAHALFSRIRTKTLRAIERKDELAEAQYAFEEICAKTLYNLTMPSAPFDADSAFWVLPLAVDLGGRLGMSRAGEISTLLHIPDRD